MDGSHDLWGLIDPDKAVLPLPVRQVLLLSIHGWAVETGTPRYGIPALPDRRAYLPAFIEILFRPDWRDELERLALVGLGDAADDLRNTITRAFRTRQLKQELVMALAMLAG